MAAAVDTTAWHGVSSAITAMIPPEKRHLKMGHTGDPVPSMSQYFSSGNRMEKRDGRDVPMR